MALGDYAALADLKARLGNITDTTSDTMLAAIITMVSREIDDYCGRRFYAVVGETRYYTAKDEQRVLIDDCLAVTALATDDKADRTYPSVWATTDYDLEPYNAQLESQPRPYTSIKTSPPGQYLFPLGVEKGVKVTGSFGFSSSTPAVIGEACLLQCELQYRATASPNGAAGGGEFGTELKAIGLHPFVKRMLETYRRLEAV